MQIIIDISEEMINLIKDKSVECFDIVHYGQILDAIYNGTPIPDNATNGDVMKIIFPKIGLYDEWDDEPYQKGDKE